MLGDLAPEFPLLEPYNWKDKQCNNNNKRSLQEIRHILDNSFQVVLNQIKDTMSRSMEIEIRGLILEQASQLLLSYFPDWSLAICAKVSGHSL